MKKEVFIAVFLGFGLGLLITIGIWTTNRALQKKKAPETGEMVSPTPEEEKEPTPTPESVDLEILKPKNNSISGDEEIELVGSTLPRGVVVVFYEEGEKIIEANEEGEFETTLSLVGGINQIIVKVFDEKGSEVEKNLEVVYSTVKI